MATNNVGLPPGFELDEPQGQSGLPPGFKLDKPNAFQELGGVLSTAARRTVAEGPTSFNVLTGGPAVAFASNLKSTALEKAGLSSNIANALAIATDPQNLMLPSLTRKSFGNIRSPGSIERLGAIREAEKGRSAVARLLPSADRSIEFGQKRIPKIDVEGLQVIRKTGDPKRIVRQFSDESNKVLQDVNNLVASNNIPIGINSVTKRVAKILEKQFKNSSKSERTKLKRAVQEELDFLGEQGAFNAVKANARKRFLFEETQKLQQSQAKGQSIIARPERQLVKDAFAQAYREAIEKAHPDIKQLNSRFKGLIEGQRSASKLAETTTENIPLSERLSTNVIGRPSKQSGFAALIRSLPFLGKSTRSLTKKIQKSRIKSDKLMAISREKQLPRLIKPRGPGIEEIGTTFKQPKALPPGETPLSFPKQGPKPPLLPKGQGFAIVPEAEAQAIARARSATTHAEVLKSLDELGIKIPKIIGSPKVDIKPKLTQKPRTFKKRKSPTVEERFAGTTKLKKDTVDILRRFRERNP